MYLEPCSVFEACQAKILVKFNACSQQAAKQVLDVHGPALDGPLRWAVLGKA
jgi:hypothetical protein